MERCCDRAPRGAARDGAARKIIDRWGHSLANAASVAAEVNRFYVYDNSVDDRDARLVLRAADGQAVKAYGDAPAWAVPILERLAPRDPDPKALNLRPH